MSADAVTLDSNDKEPSYLDYKGKYSGIRGWIFSTDHKRIGILYIIGVLTFFMAGAAFGLLMRLENTTSPQKQKSKKYTEFQERL